MHVKTVIFDIQRNSFLDGPGIRTTVFLKGCCFRCKWCHNPESFEPFPQTVTLPNGIKKTYGKEMTPQEVFDIVKQDKPFYDESGGGVTLSGGEPAIFFDFVREFFYLCSLNSIHTAIETNGFPPWKNYEAFLDYTDLFLFDYKVSDPEAHKYWTLVDLNPVLENLKRLVEINKKIILRCPVIPGVNDNDNHLSSIVELSKTYRLPVQIMPFHSTARDKWKALGLVYQFENLPSMTEEDVKKIIKRLKTLGINDSYLIYC